MSHFTKVQIKIYDKEALEEILKEMGYTISNSKFLIGYNGSKTKVDFQIKLINSYNIGFKKVDNHYEIVADWYGVKNINQTNFLRELKQKYALNIIKKELKKGNLRKYRIVSNNNNGKTIKLVLRGR